MKLLIPTTGFNVAEGLVGFGIVKLLSTTLPFGRINLPSAFLTSVVSKNLVELSESPYLSLAVSYTHLRAHET